MKLLFNIAVILLMFSVLFAGFAFTLSSDYETIADTITEKTGKELKAQKNLYLVGTGGQMMDDIQMMAMSFDYYQEIDLQVGRQLLVYVINEYLSAINHNKEIRPYLHEYPFTTNNVEIRIFIYNPDRTELPMDKINCITSRDGVLRYYVRSDASQAVHKETYEEALKIVSSGA